MTERLWWGSIDGAGSDHPIEATDIMRQNLNQVQLVEMWW